MNGLQLSQKFYDECGKDAIHELFPEYEKRIAIAFCGHGSECYGFDDEISCDHDFETGFAMFLTDEDDIKIGPRLSRLYREISKGEKIKRSLLCEKKNGVIRISDYFRRYTGSEGAPDSIEQWMALPSYALAECVNGEVFRDDLGIFTAEREKIRNGMPEDVRKKKMAAKAALMAQSGQYNYERCLLHNQKEAAYLASDEFVKKACDMIFLLNRRHAPYYKWVFRAMDDLPLLSELKIPLSGILERRDIVQNIERVSLSVINELKRQDLSTSNSDYLEDHAFEVMDRIENRYLKSLHVMEE